MKSEEIQNFVYRKFPFELSVNIASYIYIHIHTDRQSYLHAKSDHPASLKKYYTVQSNTACQKNLFKVLQQQFTKRRYDSSLIETEIKKIKLLDRKDFLRLKTT